MRAAPILGFLLIAVASNGALADPDPARGQRFFGRTCVACHSLEAGKNMTGPSLSGVWGRKAGSLPSFPRYSPALKSADLVWSDQTLDSWLMDPKAFIPGNRMIFPGLQDDRERADIIAFLKKATQPGAATGQAMPGPEGMMGMGASVPSLKSAPASARVKEIAYCGDTYSVTTADGQTAQFWERNLRFKTDSSDDGPPKGSPAIAGAGMVGDRASVIFAGPEEIGQFIKRQC
jgi:cytochrome c